MEEKDITLEDLARRYPDVENDIEEISVELEEEEERKLIVRVNPPNNQNGGNIDPYRKLLRDLLLGLTVSMMVAYARKYIYIP